MKKHINEKIGLIFISFVLAVSLFALLMLNGSMAWLSSNKDVYTSGFKVSVYSDINVTVVLKSYPVVNINEATGEYTFEKDTESYMLPTDDPNGISYSAYKKALVLLISIEAHGDSVLDLFVNAAFGVDSMDPPGLANYISNCIRITPATVSGTVATKGNSALTQTFVDVSSSPIEKQGSITLEEGISLTANEFAETCYIIEYDPQLLSYISQKIIEQNLNDSVIRYSDDIEFSVRKAVNT